MQKYDENFYKNILETSHDEIYVCDGEGRTIYCNKKFEVNYGISRDVMMGKTAMYLVENGYSDKTPIPDVIKYKKSVTMSQATSAGKTIIITATPYFDEFGEIEFIVENCRDITEIENVRNELHEKEIVIKRYKQEVENIRKNDIESDYLVEFESQIMKSLLIGIRKVAMKNVTLLIEGESGTGKSNLAKYIHKNSERKDGPFITVNCSTIPASLFESELFGYEAGAFTGAKSKGKLGYIDLSDGGTLFLDEIGEIPFELQSKFLEIIQEKRYMPVGATKHKSVDVRIITASNKNLEELVIKNKFREDLFYRLNVVSINMPALKERKSDIEILISHFLDKYNNEYGYNKTISNDTMNFLKEYNWPGNIRELQNVINNLVIMSTHDVVMPADLHYKILTKSDKSIIDLDGMDFKEIMDEYEKTIVERIYASTKSSYKMAQILKISQSTSSRLIRKHIK